MSTFDAAAHPRSPSGNGRFATKPAGEADVVLARGTAPATLQTVSPLERTTLVPSVRQAGWFVLLRDNGELELDAPYQRGSVWTTDQRRNLMRSFLLGLPVPAILLNDRANANPQARDVQPYAVIDGKQRIESVLAWHDDELDIPASWLPPEHVASTHSTDDGPYVYRSELTPAARRLIDNRATVPTCEASVPSVRDEAEIFTLVNGGGTLVDGDAMARAAGIAEGAQVPHIYQA